MTEYSRRKYQRGSHFHITATISKDNRVYRTAEVSDLSSSGLKLHYDEVFHTGDIIWFDLVVQGFFSEFELKVRGEIRRVHKHEGHWEYGVAFIGLDKDTKIRIDESILRDRPHGHHGYFEH